MLIDGVGYIAYVAGLFGETIKAQDGLWKLCGFLVTADFTEADCVAALMEMYRGVGGGVKVLTIWID